MRTADRDSNLAGDTSEYCRIRIRGRLDEGWSEWFDGFAITPSDDGTTLLSGIIPDDAALHGLLKKIRDVNLPLVSVSIDDGRLL